MSSLRALAKLMKELEDQLVVCMRCGLCQAVCPLFAETGREADVARGKLALLDGLAQEILRNPQGVQDHLNRCLLCGSCAANCPSGVKGPSYSDFTCNGRERKFVRLVGRPFRAAAGFQSGVGC